MGLFSLDKILLEEDTSKVTDIDNIGYTENDIHNHSFVQEGYNFILELNSYYCGAEKDFYSRVLGSYGDSNIINESFGDFFNKIKEIIKKFINWIKKIFKEFIAKLNGLVGSEKYIKKHSKLFAKFGYEDEFEFQGYKFTNIDKVDVPRACALDAFEDGVQGNAYFSDIQSMAIKSGKDDINYWGGGDADKIKDLSKTETDRREDVTRKLNNVLQNNIEKLNDSLDDYYEAFRGKVIGKENERFDASDYTKELFELFRDGDDTTSSITIDNNFVLSAYRRFEKYKDTIKAIEKTQKEIVKSYESLEKYLDKFIKYNKDKQTIEFASGFSNTYGSSQIDKLGTIDSNKKIYNSSTYDKMNNWLKIQSSKVNQMCQIHTQAFTAKLEACKDCFKQDKKILYKAIQKLLKRSNKEGF